MEGEGAIGAASEGEIVEGVKKKEKYSYSKAQDRNITPEEHKRCFEKNLCLYCRGEGHQAATCKAKPNTRPNPPFRQNASMRQINTDQIEDPPKQDQPDISIMSTNFFAPLATIQEDEMMNSSSSF